MDIMKILGPLLNPLGQRPSGQMGKRSGDGIGGMGKALPSPNSVGERLAGMPRYPQGQYKQPMPQQSMDTNALLELLMPLLQPQNPRQIMDGLFPQQQPGLQAQNAQPGAMQPYGPSYEDAWTGGLEAQPAGHAQNTRHGNFLQQGGMPAQGVANQRLRMMQEVFRNLR